MGFGRRDVSSQGKRSPHFFKVFFPGINSEQMEVPPAFLKHIEGHPSTCSLMGPSGNVWAVEPVRNQAGRLFFVGGWKEFVGDHAMETGEFLVFVYEGGPRFRVLIFDTTACEKESAFCAFPSSSTKRARVVAPVKRSESEVEEEEEEEDEEDEVQDSGESGEESPPPAARRMRQKRDGDWPEKRKRGPPRGRPRGRPRLLGNKIMKSRKKRSRGRLVSQRRPVTEVEIERAHRAANAFTSDYPFQVLIMRKSVVYIGHSMPLPHTFSKCHLPKVTQKMTLSDCKGNAWEVTYLPLNGTYILSAGWRKFCIDNHLEQDDACVFELIKKDEIRVHIFRVVEEVTPFMRKVVKTKGRNNGMIISQ